MPVEKNKEYIVEIIDNGFAGEGIAKIDNFTIFINGAIRIHDIYPKCNKRRKSKDTNCKNLIITCIWKNSRNTRKITR